MNFFDIVFSLIFIALIGLGIKKGVLREILSAFGFVAGYLAAERYYRELFIHLLNYIDDQTYAKIITFVAIFFFGAAIGITLSSLARVLFDSNGPTFASRIAGGGLGFVKGAFVALVVILVVQAIFLHSFGDDLNRSFYAPRLFEFKSLIVRLMAT